MGMGGMGVSIIGGTPVLMPVAKMMEAASASASSRGGGGDSRRSNGRLDDRDRDRDRDRHNGGGGRWGGGDGGEDRWAGDSPSEDDLDRGAGGGRSEAHSRRRDSGGSGGHRSRADSRDDGRAAQGQASPPQEQEEEPEEGELVIEPSALAPAVLAGGPSSSPRSGRKKSRWGNVEEEASPPPLGAGVGRGGGRLSGYPAASRADRWPSRDRGGRSVEDGVRAGAGDGEDGKSMLTRGMYLCTSNVVFVLRTTPAATLVVIDSVYTPKYMPRRETLVQPVAGFVCRRGVALVVACQPVVFLASIARPTY